MVPVVKVVIKVVITIKAINNMGTAHTTGRLEGTISLLSLEGLQSSAGSKPFVEETLRRIPSIK